MDWRKHIVSNHNILLGKPTIKGTRISLELIIGRLADGWTPDEVLESYPTLKKEDLLAVFTFIRECMKDGLLFNHLQTSA